MKNTNIETVSDSAVPITRSMMYVNARKDYSCLYFFSGDTIVFETNTIYD